MTEDNYEYSKVSEEENTTINITAEEDEVKIYSQETPQISIQERNDNSSAKPVHIEARIMAIKLLLMNELYDVKKEITSIKKSTFYVLAKGGYHI